MILRALHSFGLSSYLAAALASLAAAQTPAGATDATRMLRLRDGGILWGSIESHDEEGLRVRRLDNGGAVQLGWSLLDPPLEEELRMAFGYVELGAEELLVDADRLLLSDGTELVGLIVDRTPNEIWLKTAEGRIPVPLGRIAGAATVVKAPALDVYSKDELYQLKLVELQDGLDQESEAGAAAHFEVATYCEQLFEYVRALEHYEAVRRLDPTYRADVMDAVLKRAGEKAALQEQVDHLQRADLWRARQHYDKALEMLAEFASLYPRSPLLEDMAKLREKVGKDQERDLRDEIVHSWYRWAERLAQGAARKLGFEETLAYLDGAMGDEILAGVHANAQKIASQIQPDEVRAIWEARTGGRPRQASYGLGTWLLGEGRARAGIEDKEEGESAEAEEGSQDEARKALQEKLKRYLKNQEIAKKAKVAAGGGEDQNAFWASLPLPARTQWVLAYYAENAGDFRVDRFRFRNCRECGGTGTRQVVYTGGAVSGAQGGERLVPCPACHHIGVVRLVKYR